MESGPQLPGFIATFRLGGWHFGQRPMFSQET
jgi:hypothetical protein